MRFAQLDFAAHADTALLGTMIRALDDASLLYILDGIIDLPSAADRTADARRDSRQARLGLLIKIKMGQS